MDAECIFYIVLLIQFSSVLLSVAQVHSNVISAMATSRDTPIRTVLMLSHSDIELIYPKVNEFPIAVKFLVLTRRTIKYAFYAYFESQNCGVSREQMKYFRSLHRLVYLPFLSSVQAVHRSWVIKISKHSECQFIISSEERNKNLQDFSEALCNIAILSPRSINVPEDRYRSCGQRKDFTATWFIHPNVEPPKSFPKHQKYIAGYLWGGSSEDSNKPETLALFDVYRSLNNTFVVTAVKQHEAIAKKSVDLLLFPLNAVFLERSEYFQYAQYSPVRLCFFTRKCHENSMTFIDSWDSVLQSLLALFLAAIFVVLCALARSRTLLGEPNAFSLSNFTFSMLSTFFGRSHSIPKSQAAAYRSLAVVSWFLGIFFLGNYVQTSITAIHVVPSTLPPIRTREELSRYINVCALRPCMSKTSEHILYEALMSDSVRAFSFLIRAARCKDICTCDEDINRCYQTAQAGTHFALSSCSDEDVSAASQWGLVPSNYLCTWPQVAAIHALNPARYQHRRILLAIAEHGLAVPHRRRVAQRMIHDDPGAQPFVLYGGIYLVGCAVSRAALAAELLWRLSHRPRGGGVLQ